MLAIIHASYYTIATKSSRHGLAFSRWLRDVSQPASRACHWLQNRLLYCGAWK